MLNAVSGLQFSESTVPSWLRWPFEELSKVEQEHCAIREMDRQELVLEDAFGAVMIGDKPLAGDDNRLHIVVTGQRAASTSVLMANRYGCTQLYNVPHVIIGADRPHAVAGELVVRLYDNDYGVEVRPYPDHTGYRVTHGVEVDIVMI